MTNYIDMDRIELKNLCRTRGSDDTFEKREFIAFLLMDDKKRQEEDVANAQRFESKNDGNDPAYADRISIRQKKLDLHTLRLESDTQNLIAYLERLIDVAPSYRTLEYISDITEAKKNLESHGIKIQREFDEFKASSISRISAIGGQNRDVSADKNRELEHQVVQNSEEEQASKAIEDEQQAANQSKENQTRLKLDRQVEASQGRHDEEVGQESQKQQKTASKLLQEQSWQKNTEEQRTRHFQEEEVRKSAEEKKAARNREGNREEIVARKSKKRDAISDENQHREEKLRSMAEAKPLSGSSAVAANSDAENDEDSNVELISNTIGSTRKAPARNVMSPAPAKRPRIDSSSMSEHSAPPLPPGSAVGVSHEDLKLALNHRPHLFLNTNKVTKTSDLESIWLKMHEKTPRALEFVDWIKSDSTGVFAAFQKSGDGALAARDCRNLCFNDGWNSLANHEMEIVWGAFETRKMRVPRRYTPQLPY